MEIWGWLIRPLAAGLLAGVAVLLLPLLTVGKAAEPEKEPPQLLPVVTARPTDTGTEQRETGWDGEQVIRVETEEGTVEEMSMEEYLFRVVSAEMPASFEEEALRAQAVCARTYTLWKMGSSRHENADICADSSCCQAYKTREEMAQRWGEQTETNTRRIADAVAATDGQILTYEGQVVMALFFSSSTDRTEDAAAVWGSGRPYLVPVDSPEGEEVPNYYSQVTLTAEEISAIIKKTYPDADLTGDCSGWLSDVSYTASGRVDEMDVGGLTISGGAARSLFGLRSACFTVEEEGGVFSFSVPSYGHGVGMSQYGANAMAEAGSTWQEIVTHYYTGVEITDMNEK